MVWVEVPVGDVFRVAVEWCRVAAGRGSAYLLRCAPTFRSRDAMMYRRFLPLSALSLLVSIAACGGDDAECEGANCVDTGADAAPDMPEEDALEAVCTAGTFYQPGTSAFRDATTDWGLDGVQGTRLAVGDVDGDGWADLLVRRGGVRSNDWSPEGARHSWLMRNTGNGFEDFTEQSGLDSPRIANDENLGRPFEIVAFGDVDNDGDLDIYTGATTVDPAVARGETSEIMINSGDGFFSFTTQNNPLRREARIDVPAGASFIDANRDGNLDLWVPQHNYEPSTGGIAFSQDLFYRGDGAGLFADVTETMGLQTREWDEPEDLNAGLSHTRAWGAVACDLNNDGNAELMAPSYGRSPNHLWQAVEGADGITFENRSVASGYAYDENQTWWDNQFALCYCRDNRSAEGCDMVTVDPAIGCQNNWNHGFDRQPFRLGGNSGATVCADLNNDGWMDLLTTEIKHWWAGTGADQSDILLNNGEADVSFDRAAAREDMGFFVEHPTSPSWDEGHMSATVLDFDNDGWPDFYIGASDYSGNYGLLYQQESPGMWRDVPVGDYFEHNRSHGVVAADFDRDGDLDLIVGHSRSRCSDTEPNNCYETAQVRAFENTLGDQGNWLQVRLEGGENTNRAAIGARVEVTTPDGVTQTQEVGGGYGHYGAQNDTVLHFGLGTECEASVTVRWPDRALTEESFELVSGYRYDVAQGGEALPVGAGE